MQRFSRVAGFLRRHRRDEEATVEAIGIDLVWLLATRVGILGATAAAAAVVTVATQTSTSTYHPDFTLSVKGAAFVTRNEGVRYSPYNDPFNCTVGVGHLIHYGACTAWDYSHWQITPGQSNTLLMHDAGWAARCVQNAITRRINQPQFDALVDLTFNAGCGSLNYQGVAQAINHGDLASVPVRLAATAVTANGVYLAGLHTRRVAEGVLFARGDYGAGIGRYTPPPNPDVVPRPVPRWLWKWAAWKLDRYPYRFCDRRAACRPRSAPTRVPPYAWMFLHRFHKPS